VTRETPQSRAIKALRAEGWIVDVVERRITKFLTRDLFGGFDLFAVDGDGNTALIQVTSRSNVASRVSKIAGLPAVPWLRKAQIGLYVWGYGRTKTLGDWKKVDVS
jgi:hypothetical protein